MSPDRRRILITDTPKISALLASHQREGEARSATLVRLAEHGAASETPESGLMVFHTGRRVTAADVTAALEADDAAKAGE